MSTGFAKARSKVLSSPQDGGNAKRTPARLAIEPEGILEECHMNENGVCMIDKFILTGFSIITPGE